MASVLIPASINSGGSRERGEGSGGKFYGLKGKFLRGGGSSLESCVGSAMVQGVQRHG